MYILMIYVSMHCHVHVRICKVCNAITIVMIIPITIIVVL